MILTLLVTSAGSCAPAPAAIDWQSAAMLLEARLDSAEKDRAKVPLLANPADAPFLRALFDLDGIWAMDGEAFPTISKRCDPVRRIGRHYAALAANPAQPGKLNYQDELALAAAAYLLCKGREAGAIERFSAALPASERTQFRRDQAKEAGERTVGLVAAALRDITGPAHAGAANHRLMLDALVRVAPFLARTLSLDQRKGVLNAIDRQWDGISARDRPQVTTIHRAFEDTKCDALCIAAS